MPNPIRHVVRAYPNGMGLDGVHQQWRVYVYGNPIGAIEWDARRNCYVFVCFVEFNKFDERSLGGLAVLVRGANSGVKIHDSD